MLLAAPHLHLAEICRGLCDDIDRAVNGTDEQKDLSVAIRQADSDLKSTVISSIVKFGLADRDERQEGRLTKSANDLLMQRTPPLHSFLKVGPTQARSAPRQMPPPKFTTPSVHHGDSDDDVVDITPTRMSISATIQQRSRNMAYQRNPPCHAPDSPPDAIAFTGISLLTMTS
jgi:hypothetical protein